MDGQPNQTNVREWLEEVRALDPELLARMGVDGYATPSGDEVARFRYARDGNTYGCKVRTIESKRFWFQPKGSERHLYNFDALRDQTLRDQPVIITEGEIDCLSVIQSGFVRAVSIPDGWTEDLEGGDGAKMRPLIEAEALMRESPCVIVAGDMDGPGASMAKAVRNLLEGHDVRWVRWPDGCKDANDVLRKHGEGEVAKAINEARHMDPEGGHITGFSDAPPTPPRRFLRPDHPALDRSLVYEVGQMSVLTGVPGSGKSTMAAFAAYHVQRNEGIRVGLAMFETHFEELRNHMALLRTGAQWADLATESQRQLYGTLDRDFRLIFRDDKSDSRQNLAWLESMIRTATVRDGCKLIIIDPWNELDHLPEPGEAMTHYVNYALTRVRQLAERYDCHVQVVAHPQKIRDGYPKGYDIADSAAWFNKPALGLTVHSDEDDEGNPITKLITWKVKFRQSYGIHVGERSIEFDPGAMVYRQVAR